jgi:NADH-quinone oxidoreductase subunit J
MLKIYLTNFFKTTTNFIKTHPISFAAHLAIFAILLHLVALTFSITLFHILYSAPQAFDQLFAVLLPATAFVLAAYLPLSNNPINALFCLIFAFFTLALLFIAKEIEFLGYLLLIVYVGAIAILFLFVIMLLNVKDLITSALHNTTRYIIAAVLPVILFKLLVTLKSGLFFFFTERDSVPSVTMLANAEPIVTAATTQYLDLLVFSQLLYVQHSPLFILAAFLLLTAMLGAIVLATNATD